MLQYTFDEIAYKPVNPRPDSEEAAKFGKRIMLRHERGAGVVLFVAPANEMHSGWVIGITHPSQQHATD